MTTQNQRQPFDPAAIFHPIEHAFLSDWLGVERPACARSIDLSEDVRSYGYDFDEEEGEGVICLQQTCYGNFELQGAISNAVARLALSDIQKRLPQWSVSYRNGEIRFARGYEPPRRQKLSLLPQFLMMINWADSGPGFSWPESYHVIYLPYYHVNIVTGSVDSPEMHGYTDRALGHFTPDVPLLEGSRKIIVEDWSMQAGWGQEKWAYLFSEGMVDGAMARTWAEEVWEEEEECCDE